MADSYSTKGMVLGRAAWTPAARGRAPQVECPTPVDCPACGGLECLCRPRFFAGQLLTEDDLNRLDRYVVGKNKLHNRHLHGWGVVCGLEVVCDPCGDGVVVRPGYALAPCGEDIVVCDDQAVDLCALINACRPPDPSPCGPTTTRQPKGGYATATPAAPAATPAAAPGAAPTANGPAAPTDPCGDAVESWILAICYDETPSRGVMPLRQPPEGTACSCGGGVKSTGCGCGGKSKAKGSCGCGSKTNGGHRASSNTPKSGCGCGATSTAASAARGTYASRGAAAVACEPTLICEGYRFVAYKAPPRATGTMGSPYERGLAAALGGGAAADPGPLIERILCCWQALLARFDKVPSQGTNADLRQWLCDTLQGLLEFLTEYPTTDCRLLARAQALVCPDPSDYQTDDDFRLALRKAIERLAEVAAEQLKHCVCEALMPPCPPSPECDCVPLATIQVRRSDCRIIDVCNWRGRKLVMGFPQFEYWLSPLHLQRTIMRAIERVCCAPVEKKDRKLRFKTAVADETVFTGAVAGLEAAPPPPAAAPAHTTVVQAEPQSPTQVAALLLARAFARTDAGTPDAATLLLDALGFDSGDEQPLSPLERANPVTTLLAGQLAVPLIKATLPGELVPGSGDKGAASLGPLAMALAAGAQGATSASEVAELRRMVSELKQAVSAQGEELQRLKAKGKGK